MRLPPPQREPHRVRMPTDAQPRMNILLPRGPRNLRLAMRDLLCRYFTTEAEQHRPTG
jgi:hypothetical protein